MLKYVYRIIILIFVFVASLYYFSRDIKEVVFQTSDTTTMEDVTFPLISIKSDEHEINLLHGYSSNLDANIIRESVIPIEKEQQFEVMIDQENYMIKKLDYEVREFEDNSLIESNSISVLEETGNENEIATKISLKTELEIGKEYAVKITLITSESYKMYYYTRVKVYETSCLSEALDFIMNFHNSTRDKNAVQDIVMYLENGDTDDTSFANVNINSSVDMISWGDLAPEFITNIVPSIIEIYPDIASVELDYYVKANIAGEDELFQVKEFYRVRYTKSRMYLLNFERNMEALFDIDLTSVSQDELKLGITSDTDVSYVLSSDNKKLAFIRNRELWFYDLSSNEITKVFTFRQEQTDYIRDLYDQHDIRIINMDAEGNLDFLVYGYMNRGQYEGRNAIVLYHYTRQENTMKELVYIPIEEPYQTLKENLEDFAYINSKDVFYFSIYNTIYSYNLTTNELLKIAGDIPGDCFVALEDVKYIVWQSNPDPRNSEEIVFDEFRNRRTECYESKDRI